MSIVISYKDGEVLKMGTASFGGDRRRAPQGIGRLGQRDNGVQVRKLAAGGPAPSLVFRWLSLMTPACPQSQDFGARPSSWTHPVKGNPGPFLSGAVAVTVGCMELTSVPCTSNSCPVGTSEHGLIWKQSLLQT